MSSSEMPPPAPDDYLLISSGKRSKLQYGLPTELLQAIFLELATIADAMAVVSTCHRMYDAVKGYEKTITWTILSREFGPMLPGTFGALAIFASPRKGPADEPLFLEEGISARYWAPMLREHEELAWKLFTLGMAAQMMTMYRQFLEYTIDYSPSGECSACLSSALAKQDWNPRVENTNGNCIEHLFQANAVRFRLRCRMRLDYRMPAKARRNNSDLGLSWWQGRLSREVTGE